MMRKLLVLTYLLSLMVQYTDARLIKNATYSVGDYQYVYIFPTSATEAIPIAVGDYSTAIIQMVSGATVTGSTIGEVWAETSGAKGTALGLVSPVTQTMQYLQAGTTITSATAYGTYKMDLTGLSSLSIKAAGLVRSTTVIINLE